MSTSVGSPYAPQVAHAAVPVRLPLQAGCSSSAQRPGPLEVVKGGSYRLPAAGSGWFPAGERDDATRRACRGAAGFHSELVDDTHQRRDAGAQPGELFALGGDPLPEPGDRVAEPGLIAVRHDGLPDAPVELGLHVGVALGERVARDTGLDGGRNDGRRAIEPFPGYRPGCGPSRCGSGRARRARRSSGVLPGGDPGPVVLVGLVLEPGGAGPEPAGVRPERARICRRTTGTGVSGNRLAPTPGPARAARREA
jgi:hypothetical protein